MNESSFRSAIHATVGFGLICVLAACSSSTPSDKNSAGSGASAGTSTSGSSGAAGSGSISAPPSLTPTIPVPDGGQAAPTATTDLPLSNAPDLGEVKYIPNRSNVRLYLPGVTGARDYRVFAVEDGVKISVGSDQTEHVDGATLHCAGLRQRNQCDDGEILPVKYNNDQLDSAVCEQGGQARRPNVPAQLMQTMDVDGVAPGTTLVVEAIDRQCPFPGMFGTQHVDVPLVCGDVGGKTVDVVVNDTPYTLQRLPDTFPVVTEAEIRAQYGSMILNGQGPNYPTFDTSSPNFPESPFIRISNPAPPDDPVVLARSVVTVSPTGDATLPDGFSAGDYYDDFDDPTDQPQLVRSTDPAGTFIGLPIKVYETSKWVLYDVANQFSEFFVDRGHLVMAHGDTAQDSMTTQAMYPKRPVQLPTEPDQYLHVTYQVQRNETPRRYENFTLCGSDKLGDTYDGETPKGSPIPRPGFMNELDTTRTNIYGWNCLMLVPRGAGYAVVPGGDIASHPDSSLKITVVATHPPPATATDYDMVKITPYATAFGPLQEGSTPIWERQMDSSFQPSGVWLDDQLNSWQKTRFDLFIRRDRVVIYVEGEQRICQELTDKPLTMAEGALGFWHVLYHTSAEFMEIRNDTVSDNPKTDQHNVEHNWQFADERAYDNVGFKENVGLPANFDASRCFAGSSINPP
jgi:hypothetical protein